MKRITKTFTLFLAITLLSIITVSASAVSGVQSADIQPRYIGVYNANSDLDISSSGLADILGSVAVKSGYTANVTVTLYKDSGSRVDSWSRSGGGTIEVQQSRYVTSGHDYYVTLSATIYNSSGQRVDTITTTSAEVYY
jgi:hypothetical protein